MSVSFKPTIVCHADVERFGDDVMRLCITLTLSSKRGVNDGVVFESVGVVTEIHTRL